MTMKDMTAGGIFLEAELSCCDTEVFSLFFHLLLQRTYPSRWLLQISIFFPQKVPGWLAGHVGGKGSGSNLVSDYLPKIKNKAVALFFR